MIFRQLFDPQSATYTYLVADENTREALLVDPVFEQARRDAALVKELGLRLTATVETHVHADHVTGAWLLKQKLGSRIGVPAASGVEGADFPVGEEAIRFGSKSLEPRHTPGHTGACTTYVLDDRSLAFTGDALLIRGCGRTDFQAGDAHQLFRSVREQIFSLPDRCLLYPGHDYRGLTVTSVGEEKLYNPRLGEAVGEGDFVGYMRNLGLPYPRQMDLAVPANLRCGRPEAMTDAEPDWAPLTYTFAGVWEIEPRWLEEHLSEVQIVDVREPAECDGDLGRIPGSLLMPLGTLMSRAREITKDRPVVTVCRSGARSAQASVLLAKGGFDKVANLAGGMLRWRAQRLAVEGGSD
ncbi:MAG TPA: MBL fold metallo-hydrolase [Burkholderiales bacterium]|jgi:glyoxylase-like metal-dependent hydrolase (beta-lactamase superfamily II)|nr:MBL fold metallo-hydrolase [Burkholderiales bacterium]